MKKEQSGYESAGATLFREQAVNAATQRYGAPVGAPGVGMWLAAGFVLLLLAAAIIFLSTTVFPRKETVHGSLVPSAGLLSITSMRSGVVSQVYVEEGEVVREGQPILRVSVDSIINGKERAGAALADATEGQSRASFEQERAVDASFLSQEAGVRARIKGIDQQLRSLLENMDLYKEQLGIAEKTVRDIGRLLAERLVSQLQYRDAEVRVLNIRQVIVEAQIRIADMRQQRAQLLHEVERLAAERDANHASAVAERLVVQEKGIRYRSDTEFELVAQQAGKVTALRAKLGEMVTAGRSLGALMPAGSHLIAEVWVPSSAIAFINSGTEMRLMYDAFPYQKFGIARGKVVKIARSPTMPEELPLDLQAKESQYRVLAELESQQMIVYGKRLSLTTGMRFRADLVMESRFLLDWLLEPLMVAKG